MKAGGAGPRPKIDNTSASAPCDAFAVMEKETAAATATHEDRRVMAFASELRISSAISPRELLSLRLTSPLESNDELESEEGGGKGEDTASSRGGNISGSEGPVGRNIPTNHASGSAAVSVPPSHALGRGDAAAATPAPARALAPVGMSSSSRRRVRRRRQQGNGDDDGASDSSSGGNGNGNGNGRTTARGYRLRDGIEGGGGSSGRSSTGLSGTSSSADNDSWMRSPTGGFGSSSGGGGGGGGGGTGGLGTPASSDVGGGGGKTDFNNASSLHFLGGGGGGGGSMGGAFFEDTASSSSATLSLQLPFSEDEAALLNVLGQTLNLPADGGGGGGLNVATSGSAAAFGGGLAALQHRRDLLEGLGLPGGGGEGIWARTTLGLKEELTNLERRREALEGELRRERARHESQIQSLEKRWLEQVAALKKEQEMAQIERDTLDARLRDKKDMYKDLALSDALARELRRVPEEDQTIKEYVSLTAHELVASSKGELERTRRELEKTQEQLLATTETGELQRREDARARRLATAREEGLKVDLEALRERSEEMSGRAREAQRAANENRDKARAFDEVEASLRTARLELDAARALCKTQAEALADVAESEKAAARTAQDASQRSAMLEMDKTYLQRELCEAQSRADRLGRESEAASERVRDLERSKDALAAELVSVRERTRSEHEERLEAEVGRLREQGAKEMADIRASGREVYERENEVLREAKKDAMQECARVRGELSELQRAHEDLVMAMAKSDAAHETSIGEVRSEVRLKSFELGQLGVAHAEKCSSLRQAGLELDMLKEQVAVHRTEFAELEASTTRKTSELQLLLVAERGKVRAFEDLELEVDGAVMRTGRGMLLAEDVEERVQTDRPRPRDDDGGRDRAGPGPDDGNNDNGSAPPPTTPEAGVAGVCTAAAAGGGATTAASDGGGGVLGSVLGGVSAGGGVAAVSSSHAAIPMAPHRRLRQAVLLAHKLLRKEGELDVARRELADLQSRAASWQNRASEAEGLLETVEQPTKYMIDSIRSKDGEIESLRSAQHRLVAKTEALERACREAAEEKASLEKDLEQSARRAERARLNAERRLGRISRSPGFGLPREADTAECEAGGAPARAPPPPPSAFSGFAGEGDGLALPSGLLSEKLTVHGGRRVAEGGPRWYSYRQSTAIRVPS